MRNSFKFIVVLGIAGCGGATVDEIPTQTGQSIFTTSVQKLVAENEGGGFAPPPPPGSACTLSAAKYTLTVATRQFDWTRCVNSGSDPYTEKTGSRVLGETEFKNLSLVLNNLKVVKDDGCGADKPLLTVTITTASGTQQYADSFYACTIKDKPLIATEAMDQAFAAFYMLAMP